MLAFHKLRRTFDTSIVTNAVLPNATRGGTNRGTQRMQYTFPGIGSRSGAAKDKSVWLSEAAHKTHSSAVREDACLEAMAAGEKKT